MSIAKDLIRYANKGEEFRKSLHRKDKISQHDCKEYRLGMLTVLSALDFLTYEDEPMDIANKAGAWDKELKGEKLQAPTADVVEVRHGEWVPAGMFDDMAKCSVCGLTDHSLNEVYSRGTYNYCHNCGAKMDGERSENGT